MHLILFLIFISEGYRFAPSEPISINFNQIPAWNIFQNNVSLGFYLLKTGWASLSVSSLLTLYFNGLQIGSSFFIIKSHYGTKGLLTGLPHVFFEVIAISLFSALACYPFYMVIRHFKIKTQLKFIAFDISFGIIIGIILLAISSVMESYFSFV